MPKERKRFTWGLVVVGFLIAVCCPAQERKGPQTAGEWNLVGMGMATQERWQEAAQAFQQAVRLKPSFVEAQNNLGFALQTLGKPSEAVKAYQQAIKAKPDNPTPYYNLGFTYETMGSWQEAVESFQQALKYSPGWELPSYHLGFSYLKLGLWKQSVGAFQQYLNPQPVPAPSPTAPAASEGQAHPQGGDDSIQEGVLVLSIEPEKYIVLANLAYAYQQLGQYLDAIATYRQSVQLKPDFADGHYSLGETYVLAGSRESALEECATLQKLNKELADKLRALIDKPSH